MTASYRTVPPAPELLAQPTNLRAAKEARLPPFSLSPPQERRMVIISAALHAAGLALILALVLPRLPRAAPEAAIIELIPETPPQGDNPSSTAMADQLPQPPLPMPMAANAELPLPPPSPPLPQLKPARQAQHQGTPAPQPRHGKQLVQVTRPATPAAGNAVPEYSLQARLAGEQGEVRFVVSITPAGAVSDVTITGGSGYPDLDDSVLTAVRQWHFRPALRNGKPVAAMLKLWVRFEPQ